jgi:diaminohydroxyphosphoribosylaminopyrimidine deaminase/5-amino-6-(5-phosphoribosylamino)uracil reductase
MSLDGKIATYTGKSKWITSEASRRKVHELRDTVDAILVGIGTVINDNPSLTTRLLALDPECNEGEGTDREGKDAIRVIVDSKAQIPLPSKVLNLDSMAPTIIAVTQKAPENKISQLKATGAEVLVVPECNDGRVGLKALMEILGKRQITSVMIEGGSEINASALKEGIVDKVMIFIAPKFIGGKTAPGLVGGQGIEHLSNAIELRDIQVSKIGEDILVEGYIREE